MQQKCVWLQYHFKPPGSSDLFDCSVCSISGMIQANLQSESHLQRFCALIETQGVYTVSSAMDSFASPVLKGVQHDREPELRNWPFTQPSSLSQSTKPQDSMYHVSKFLKRDDPYWHSIINSILHNWAIWQFSLFFHPAH